MAEVRTACPYCGTGCGLVMSEGRNGWAVGGDPAHPANLGRLCSKGAALPDTLTDTGRLLYPEVEGRRVGWEDAIAAVAGRLSEILARRGPEAVAFYVSGQLLTEDYYVANKLLKGFIGSPHIDTNSRLCMASTVAGHRRAFGADVVPGCYEDLEQADLVLLVGSNLAWCHPVLHQRLLAARRSRGTRIVVIDPRRTASCGEADLHLALRPGSDVALFNGLLAHLAEAGACDRDWIGRHVEGYEAALASARAEAPDAATVARLCDLPQPAVERLFDWVAATRRTVTLFSQGVNQSIQGSDKVNAILNLHLATGRIGRPGCGPFSVTGQPNAMGGREVGGLANQLAAHLDPDDPDDVARLRRFWRAPALRGGQGLKAVDLFRAVEEGRIEAVWIMATNPAVSLPEAERVRRALARCPLVIVSDVVRDTDSRRFAHIRLPAAAWGEKSGTVTNSERRISRQRAFRTPPGEARPDWWIISRVGQALGHGRAFDYRSPAAIFREHAALSAFENDGRRAFDIGACARLSDAAYEGLEPFQWPWRRGQRRAEAGRLYGDGRFHTPDGRARMLALRLQAPAEAPSPAFPLLANSGRYRDQWHSMTRTGLAARLSAHRPEPLLEVAAEDAAAAGLREGGLAWVESARGRLLLRVAVSEGQVPGQIFLPIHWSDGNASAAVVSRLVGANLDPVSGQPESKLTPVRLRPAPMAWSGLLLTRRAPVLEGLDYWCRHSAGNCTAYELAGAAAADEGLAQRLLPDGDLTALDYFDRRGGVRRRAWLDREERLAACLFMAPERPRVARDWLGSLFAGALDGPARRALLAGRAAEARPERGRLVCACFGVGLLQIEAAVREGRALSVEAVGQLLSAGTGCGSCVPEIREILRHERSDAAA